MPVWIGPTIKLGLILAILLSGWAFLRWVLKRASDRQASLDTIKMLQGQNADLAAKLRAALAAAEVLREEKRDAAGLPADLSLQPRQKPVSGTLGQPPHRPETSA